jgi:hypothetical protein
MFRGSGAWNVELEMEFEVGISKSDLVFGFFRKEDEN